MIRNIILAATLAIGVAGVAQAQPAPQLLGGGDDAQVVYGAPSRNVVGGGTVVQSGGAESRSFVYSGMQDQRGPAASLIGGGVDRTLVYAPPAGSNSLAQNLAGRTRG